MFYAKWFKIVVVRFSLSLEMFHALCSRIAFGGHIQNDWIVEYASPNGNELTLIRTKSKTYTLSNRAARGNRMQNTGFDLDLWACSLFEWKFLMAKEINQSLSHHIVSWNIMQIKNSTGKKREIERTKRERMREFSIRWH